MKEEGKERRKGGKGSERKRKEERRFDTGKNWTREYVVLNVTA